MTEVRAVGSRGAAIVLVVAGLLTMLLSFQRWTSCSTTPCGGFLQAISEYSGLDLGFGAVTAISGVMLAAIGLGALRQEGVTRLASAVAVLLALVIVVTVGASVVWMYVIPGEDKDYHWPPFTAILVGIVGLIALIASLRLWRATLPSPANMTGRDDPQTFWKESTEFLRGLKLVPEAQANAWLLDQARDRWASVVVARTSMHSLLFTMPEDAYPFDLTVLVSWRADVYEFTLAGSLKPLVTADRCFAVKAPAVLDAFLYQLAGAAAPAWDDSSPSANKDRDPAPPRQSPTNDT